MKHRMARQHNRTECWLGHPLTGENLYIHPTSGHKRCRECIRQRMADYRGQTTPPRSRAERYRDVVRVIRNPMARTTAFELTARDADRFWQNVAKAGAVECWEWSGPRWPSGYGTLQVKVDGKWRSLYAHRIAFTIGHGPIPAGLVVRHKCDNPPCVNPAHLEIGTFKDNIRDAVSRGRWIQGSNQFQHKSRAEAAS